MPSALCAARAMYIRHGGRLGPTNHFKIGGGGEGGGGRLFIACQNHGTDLDTFFHYKTKFIPITFTFRYTTHKLKI